MQVDTWSETDDPVQIDFWTDPDTGVISIHPSSVKISQGSNNFTLTFSATGAGKTTVKANTTDIR